MALRKSLRGHLSYNAPKNGVASDLQCNYCTAWNHQVLDVIATFFVDDSGSCYDQEEEELVQIILRHAPNFIPSDGGDWRLGPFDEEASQARSEELESLQAIYGSELLVVSEAEWLVSITEDVALRIHLTSGLSSLSSIVHPSHPFGR